ncbi:unannotated protein [freshwater metagenome]|uniref:Unannotated protein n=1 Tax=freshwater metagenome TaxID=449393 RepID=A0A6J7GDS6_9ZZZZ
MSARLPGGAHERRRECRGLCPRRRVALGPRGAELGVEELLELVADPRAGVDAVGDRADPRPERHGGEHLATYGTVQLRDAVGPAGGRQAERRHVERLHRAVACQNAQLEQFVAVEIVRRGPRFDVAGEQFAGEAIDAGGYRRVRGEQGDRADVFERCRDVLGPGATSTFDEFEHEQTGVAFVQVEARGRDAEGFECPDAPDAEHQFLAQAVLLIAAIQTVGDGAHGRGVRLEIGVEQIERDATDVDAPDLGLRRDRTERGIDDDPGIGSAEHHRILLLVALGLATVDHGLLEEPLAIEQAHAEEREVLVAGCLQVIASEDPEASRILRQRLVDAELGREVRGDPRRCGGQLSGERRVRVLDHGNCGPVVDEGGPCRVVERGDRHQWVGIGLGARERADLVDKSSGRLVPPPAVVTAEIEQ